MPSQAVRTDWIMRIDATNGAQGGPADHGFAKNDWQVAWRQTWPTARTTHWSLAPASQKPTMVTTPP